MLANRVEPIHRHKWIRHRFWYKQRIAGPVESPGPFSEVLEIDIGRQEINAGRARAPHVDQMRQWTSARILTGLVSRPNQCGVYKHRQRIFGFAVRSNSIHIPRKVPGHEDLICSRTFAKDFLPCAASLELICRPYGAKFGK